MSLSDRLLAETAEFASVLLAWLLVGVPVGSALETLVAGLTGVATGQNLSLLVGGVVAATVEAVDRRPPLPAAVGFFVVWSVAGVPAVVAGELLPGLVLGATVDALVPLATAYVVVVRWGLTGTVLRARRLLARVTKTPTRGRTPDGP